MNAAPSHDLFLSYHSPDRDTVLAVRTMLEARGVTSFLDRSELVVGQPWPHALEDALARVRAVAIFLGPHGLGTWQKRELWYALDRQAAAEQRGESFPVIPILLRGADPAQGFLSLNTWIDLREHELDADALESLERAVHGAASRRTPLRTCAISPYRSMYVFEEEHQAFFFGRDNFIERLFAKTAAYQRGMGNLVAVIGPSGSGKSSLVRAGLLPRLRRERPPATTWDAAICKPGDRPFHRLAQALLPLLESGLDKTNENKQIESLGNALMKGEATLTTAIEQALEKSKGTDRLLLVVDQFEELFRLTPPEHQQPFVEMLLGALSRSAVTVLLTLRSDFHGHATSVSRELSDLLEQNTVILGPMRIEELRSSIVQPARLVGFSFEEGLPDRILADVGQEPGNLPLMEYALTELWSSAKGGLLCHDAYKRIGEVKGAIAKVAEDTYGSFTPEQQVVVRQIFSRLVQVGRPEEGGADTSRRMSLTEVSPSVWPLIQRLADARLLVTDRGLTSAATSGTVHKLAQNGTSTSETPHSFTSDTVEVAHESLIRGWGRLRDWLSEDREFLVWRQHLDMAIHEWERTRHDPGTLFRGAPLSEAERWTQCNPTNITEPERNFIHESIAREQAEQAWQHRAHSKTATIVFLTLIVGCLYSWLIFTETSDGRLLDHSASTLPILGARIPLAYFYWAAPVALVFLYLFWHAGLQQLREMLQVIAAPSRQSFFNQIGHRWLVAAMLHRHTGHDGTNEWSLSRLAAAVISFLAWWLVPLTLIAFWIRYLPRHDWWGTALHITILTICLTFGLQLYQRASSTLRPVKERATLSAWWLLPMIMIAFWTKYVARYQWEAAALLIGLLAICLVVGLKIYERARVLRRQKTSSNATVLPAQLYLVVGLTFALTLLVSFTAIDDGGLPADLTKQDISEKPGNWSGAIESIRGAKLARADLTYAEAWDAFLIKADLSLTKLQYAHLDRADLRYADLLGAKLDHANLTGANLQSAYLSGADLQHANLYGANLYQASLVGANLRGANLAQANLRGADMRAAMLSQGQIDRACVDDDTRLPDGLRRPNPCPDGGH